MLLGAPIEAAPEWANMTVPERTTAVKALLGQHGTMTSIGAKLLTSRSAIASHVYRYREDLGLPAADKHNGAKARAVGRTPKAKAPARRTKRRPRAPIYQIMPADADRLEPEMLWQKPEFSVPIEDTEPAGLLDLGFRDCRWPLGEKPTLYCGQRAGDKGPYCAHHHRLAYQKVAA